MTIRAIYAAVHAGQGDVAASMIVSEKTVIGPLSATSLSHFYGNLKTPIELINVSMLRSDTYFVTYELADERIACKVRSMVETVQRDCRNYIVRIRALDGC